MSALNVLHIAPYSPETWAYGGIPRVVGAFTQGLARRGHAVTVCATDALTSEARLARPEGRQGGVGAWPPLTTGGVTTRIFPNLSNRLAYDWQCFTPVGLGGFLRRHAASFDVAHLHACRNFPVAIAARHLRRAGVPFILGPNGTASRIERRQTAKRAWDLLLGDAPLRQASAVLAVSGAERRQLLDLGVPDSEIHVIPNPVDLDEFAEPLDGRRFRETVGVGDAPLVLFLGKLTPRKRVDVLVEAFARVGHPTARLVIAGNDMGSLAEVRTAVRSHGLQDRTVFTGLLPGRVRLEALTAADLVVYPSDHEVFGLVPLEALLCETPVIVADDSGCGEVIRDVGGGKVIPLGDAVALAVAVGEMLGSPVPWRTRAVAASGRVRDVFGRDTVTAQLDALYHSVRRPAETSALGLSVMHPATDQGDAS